MRIDNYESLKEIKTLGEQSIRKFNTVFLVEDELEQKFVQKRCLLSNESGCQLLLEEFKFSFDDIQLPSVVKLDRTEAELILTLDYKFGVPLDIHWKNLRRKERKVFLSQFIPQFLELIQSVHKKGIVHNDIRPGNIIIDGESIHLIDFGMATRIGEETKRKFLFSLQYASPELILNQMHVLNPTSDLFSFALVLIQLLNGKPILSHSNPSVLTNLAITYPIDLKGIVPKEFRSLLEQMCIKATFLTAPNRMDPKEVVRLLKDAQKRRVNPQLIVEWNTACKSYSEKRKWFG